MNHEVIIQEIINHTTYDKYFIVCSERLAIKLASVINKTCRSNNIGMRARCIFPGVTMEFAAYLKK